MEQEENKKISQTSFWLASQGQNGQNKKTLPDSVLERSFNL